MKRAKLIVILSVMLCVFSLCACGHVHTYSDTYSFDETYHWYASICEHDEVSSKAEHDFDNGAVQLNGDTVFTCLTCGYEKTVVHEHTFATEYSSNETHHWYASTCGHSVEGSKAEHNFNNGAVQLNGDVLFTCETCGYEKTVVHEHTFATEYSSNETHHWYASTCGHSDQEVKGEHDFDSGVTQLNGDVLYTCETCGYEFVEGHEHTFATEYSSNETHHWYASTCGHNVEDSKAEHDFDDGAVQSNGDTIFTCETCDYEKTVVHEHTFATEYSSNETHHWYASTCGHSDQEVKGEHDFDDGVVQSNGDTVFTCETCGYKMTVLSGEVIILGIEVEQKSTENYVRTSNVEDYLKYKIVYSNSTYSEYYDVTKANVTACEVSNSKLNVTVSTTIANVKFSDNISIEFVEDVKTVVELKSQAVDGEYLVSGIVSAIATTVNQNEVVLLDKVTGNAISVVGLGTGNVYNATYYLDGIEIGDEIVIPVALRKSLTDSTSANSNKLYAEFIGGNYLDLAVVTSENAITYETAQTVIDNQEDLETFLSAQNRENNVYKTVKFTAQVNYVMDSNYEIYNFWMYNKSVQVNDDLQISGLIPSISNASTYLTYDKTFGEIMFGNSHASSMNLLAPEYAVKEFTALYLGGNDKYAQFVLVSQNAVELTPVLTGVNFTKPTKLNYVIGDEVNLAGSQLELIYDIKSSETIEVTASMMTIPVLDTAGNFEIKGVYEGFEFSYEITVFDAQVESIELYSNATKSTYTHRDTFESIDLTGAQLKVEFDNETIDYVDITKQMIDLSISDEWKIGTVNYKVTYLENTVDLPIVYENTALTVSQFKAGVVGTSYDLTGIVVSPVATGTTAEILIKEKNTENYISIVNSGCAGSAKALALDTTVLKPGDEIVVNVTLKQLTTGTTGNLYRHYADATDYNTFVSSLKTLSTGNNYDFDFDSAITISTQQGLKNFLSDTEGRAYKLVKLSGIKAVRVSARYSAIFFSEATTKAQVQYNDAWVVLDRQTSNQFVTLNNYFPNVGSSSTSITYENPASTDYDMYALFIGGPSGYYSFIVLGSSWFVTPTVA